MSRAVYKFHQRDSSAKISSPIVRARSKLPKRERASKPARRHFFPRHAPALVADDFIQRRCPGRPGYDDVVRVVAFVLSLQRLYSARFNILTKIPGATGGAGDKGGLRGAKGVRRWWFAGGGGGYTAKLSRRAATGMLATCSRDRGPERIRTKVSRCASDVVDVAVLVDGKLAVHTREHRGREQGKLHERVT